MEVSDDMHNHAKVICAVCGECEFELLDGFYYCQECGTKQEQMRDIEVEENIDYSNEKKNAKVQKIKTIKSELSEITSWECYNFILRGLVDELLDLGAKEDVKLMTLQLWAAYLRRMEIAFFNRKQAELPKLGARFSRRDARALYNHEQARKKRKRCRTDGTSVTSKDTSNREFRKAKRKLDESMYSAHSSSLFSTSLNTSFSSKSTTGAIRLKFSMNARKHFKKKMPLKHLENHANDPDNTLQCHKLSLTRKDFNRNELNINTVNMKKLYTILAIALNLVEDSIQLSDLARFINEKRLDTKNVLQYFPENMAPDVEKCLHEIHFYSNLESYTDKMIRTQCGLLAQFLNIHEFKTPNISKLVVRYLTDLNLPNELSNCVLRLINILPPQMKTRCLYIYPAYEARAMAYIVFTLKLLFGLDGHKEQLISKSAIHINTKINLFTNRKNSVNKLFVWNEWVEYIEMRKVIISKYNQNYCRQFKQFQSMSVNIDELQEDQKIEINVSSIEMIARDANLKHIFESLSNNLAHKEAGRPSPILFSACFTPGLSYFKRILLCASIENKTLPEYMRVDHSQRELEPYLDPNSLRKVFEEQSCYLAVKSIACTENREFVGIFGTSEQSSKKNRENQQEADFDITESEWLRNIQKENPDELVFKTQYGSYHKKHIIRLKAKFLKLRQGGYDTVAIKNYAQEVLKTVDNSDQFSDPIMNSFDIFDESDMNPIVNLTLTQPRRNLNGVNIFDDISDNKLSETLQQSEVPTSVDKSTTATLLTSNMDYWILMGNRMPLDEKEKEMLRRKLPLSFFWLLETCAQTIGVEWIVVYEQLLAIELMFGLGIENINDFKDCLRFSYNNPVKDLNVLINTYRKIW